MKNLVKNPEIPMRLIFMPVFLVVLASSYAQLSDDMKNKEAIARNKVKNRINWDYGYSGNKPGKNGVKTSITTYSDNGEIIQVNAYNPKGAILHTEKYTYDSRGNKTGYTRNSGENSYQKTYNYDERNKLTEENGFDGVEHFRNLYTYNSQAEMAEIRYMKKSVLQEKRIFTKTGTSTTVSIYNAAGILFSKVVLKYDSRGNLTEETVYGMNQGELEKKTYNYDDQSNLKEETKYKLDKIALKITYNYTASGALLEILEESPEVPRFVKKSLNYNASGNLLEIKWRRKGAEEFNKITYQYDNRGLCISADTYYPASKYRVLTRYTYEYY